MQNGFHALRVKLKYRALIEDASDRCGPVEVPLLILDEATPRVGSMREIKAVKDRFRSGGIDLKYRSARVVRTVLAKVIATPASCAVQVSFPVPEQPGLRIRTIGGATKCVQDGVGLSFALAGPPPIGQRTLIQRRQRAEPALRPEVCFSREHSSFEPKNQPPGLFDSITTKLVASSGRVTELYPRLQPYSYMRLPAVNGNRTFRTSYDLEYVIDTNGAGGVVGLRPVRLTSFNA